MAKIEIIGAERGFSPDPNRIGKFDRFIVYRGEDQVLHIAITPDETYTLQAAEAAVRKAEAERRLATPHSFNI